MGCKEGTVMDASSMGRKDRCVRAKVLSSSVLLFHAVPSRLYAQWPTELLLNASPFNISATLVDL